MMTHQSPAAHAQQYRYQLAEQPSLADALDPDYLCDETEEDELEREGRREMYATLFGDEFYG